MNSFGVVLTVLFAALCAQLAPADAVRVITMEEVPALAQAELRKQAGKSRVVDVSKVVEEGTTYYEVRFVAELRPKVARVNGNDGRLIFR